MESKECLECKKIFQKNKSSKQVFCSRGCAVQYRHNLQEKTECLNCHKQIMKYTSRGIRKHCSIKCRKTTYSKQRIQKTCEHCGKLFSIKKSEEVWRNRRRGYNTERQKHCSYKCREFLYHPIIQAEFWRSLDPTEYRKKYLKHKTRYTPMDKRTIYQIPQEWLPDGITKSPDQHRWTNQQVMEFREWNQKNV